MSHVGGSTVSFRRSTFRENVLLIRDAMRCRRRQVRCRRSRGGLSAFIYGLESGLESPGFEEWHRQRW